MTWAISHHRCGWGGGGGGGTVCYQILVKSKNSEFNLSILSHFSFACSKNSFECPRMHSPPPWLGSLTECIQRQHRDLKRATGERADRQGLVCHLVWLSRDVNSWSLAQTHTHTDTQTVAFLWKQWLLLLLYTTLYPIINVICCENKRHIGNTPLGAFSLYSWNRFVSIVFL